MSTELFGFDVYAVWLDITAYNVDMTGLWFDGGPVYGGLFVSVVDMIKFIMS